MKPNRYIIFIILFLFTGIYELKAIKPESFSDRCIFGHVTDSKTGEHMPGVTVSVKGTTIGTTTDASGHFSIANVPADSVTIELKALGYKYQAKTVSFKGTKTVEIRVTMIPDPVSLDEVVVSSNRNATVRRLAPTLIHTLDAKDFENSHSYCLAQGLNYQSGLRVEDDCHTCGTEQVRINGLEGPYTQILIDSRPILSSLAGVYGLEQIPESMIKRVEIAKGGGSALYGSSAIAGTINVITKEPENNSGRFSHDITSIGGTNALDNTTSLDASLISPDQKTGYVLFAQSRYRDGYDRDGDGYTELPEMRNQTIGMHSFYKMSEYSKLSLEYHSINDYRRGGDSLSLQPHEATVAEQAEHNINGGGINLDMFSPDEKSKANIYASVQHVKRKSYSGADHDLNGYGNTNDLTWLGGVQYTRNWDKFIFMPAEFTGGTEYTCDYIEDQIIGYHRDIKQTVHDESLFLQNEWKDDKWGFLIGGRFDRHNMIDHVIFSPRVTLRYNPASNINLRMSYSTGFRAPQIYDEDLHVSAVSGEVALIYSAPDLKEETSQSLNASADWYFTLGTIPGNLTMEGFYTNLDNVFVIEDKGVDAQGNILKERTNGSGATVAGITSEGKLVVSSYLSFQAGMTWQKSRYRKAENWSDSRDLSTKRMLRTPDVYGYFTADLTPFQGFSADLSGTYTGEMLVPHAAGYIAADENVTTPDFFDVNIKLSHDFKLSKSLILQLNCGVENIFDAYQSDADKGKNRDSDFVYGPDLPRSYFLGIKVGLPD